MAIREREARKVLSQLSDLVFHEERQLSKIRRYKLLFNLFGFGLLVGVFAVSGFSGGWLPFLLTLLAVGAGFIFGLVVHLESSLSQWPVIRRFLDVEAIRHAAAELEQQK